MTTMNGFRMEEEKNSIKITCSNFSGVRELKNYLDKIEVNTKESIFEAIGERDFSGYTITINTYDDVLLVVLEEEDGKDKEYYLFDTSVRSLKVSDNFSKIEFKYDDKIITNESLNEEDETSLLVHFINYLATLQKIIPFNLNSVILCSNLRIFDDENNTIITEDKEIILAQPNFYKNDIRKMRLNIILKKGLRVVGSMECYLNEEGESNFSYRGNLAFNIYKGYTNKGYERKSLKVLKDYIDKSEERVNKELFIAGTLEDDLLISSIATSCGGRLNYDGAVPKSDPLNYLGKVREVKVYRIG